MSRNKKSNDIRTRDKHVPVGKRVFKNGEPQLLVGPASKKDLYTMQEMTEDLFGEGYKCFVISPDGQTKACL